MARGKSSPLPPLSFFLLLVLLLSTLCQKAEKGGDGFAPVRVPVTQARPSPFSKELRIAGTVSPLREVDLFFRLGGKVAGLFVEEGNSVRAGQLVALLDTVAVKAYLDLADADFDLARAEYRRAADLHERGHAAVREFDLAEAQLRKAEASQRLAREKYRNCLLRSPIDGNVIYRGLEPGENLGDIAAQSTLVCRIAYIDSIYVDVAVSEQVVGSLREGMDVVVETASTTGASIDGKIGKIGLSSFPGTHSFRVRVVVENRDHDLLPGMIAEVSFRLEKRDDVLLVPAGSIVEFGAGRFLYLYRNGRARKVAVKVGERDLASAIIEGGLSAGDTVIVGGVSNLFDGKEVRPDHGASGR